MVDSVLILNPGWRALDDTGTPFTDAVLTFYDAGTSNLRTVYSDSGLSTSLGSSVDCDAGGTPESSASNPTLIYTGSSSYKVNIASAIAGFSRDFDNVLGALDTSSFLTQAAVADRSVVAVSTNRSVTSADKGKILDVNCSGGDITMTLDDAATLDDGFFVSIRHNGTANQVRITGDGSDTFGIPGANVTGFSLTGRGQGCMITCDAVNFKTDAWTEPLISGNTGVIVIADRLSTPAGSPEAGARYIVGSSPTGAWSGFAEHDIAEADGFGNWFNYTPATDAGWLAYVQDENAYYSFEASAWVQNSSTDTIAGRIRRATQSDQETVSAVDAAVVPGRQHFHPGHPKAGGRFNGTGTPAFASGDYGMGAITDNGTGDYTLALDTAFANTNYWWTGNSSNQQSANRTIMTEENNSPTRTTSSIPILTTNTTNASDSDQTPNGITFWGDYA